MDDDFWENYEVFTKKKELCTYRN